MGLDNPKLMISLQAEGILMINSGKKDSTTAAIKNGGAASVALTPLNPIIVRPGAIQAVTGLSKSQALYLEKTEPNFPKRVRFGKRANGWLYAELQAYFRNLPRI